jgi:hypothetical protein
MAPSHTFPSNYGPRYDCEPWPGRHRVERWGTEQRKLPDKCKFDEKHSDLVYSCLGAIFFGIRARGSRGSARLFLLRNISQFPGARDRQHSLRYDPTYPRLDL